MYNLSKHEIKEKYNKLAKYYNFLEFPLEFLIIGRLRKNLLKHASGKVLEIGIGTGKSLSHYNKNCEITGVDFSENMLENAKKLIKNNKKVKLLNLDVENMPFKDKSFDVIVDNLGLCTYKNPVKVLKELKRCTKKDVKILLLEHGISNIKFIRNWQIKIETKHYQKVGCSLIRDHEILARKSGLKIINLKKSLFGIMYSIIAKP